MWTINSHLAQQWVSDQLKGDLTIEQSNDLWERGSE